MTTPDQPSPISHVDADAPPNLCAVDSQCNLTPQSRWQIVLFAAIGIAVVSGFFFGMYYVLQKLGLVD